MVCGLTLLGIAVALLALHSNETRFFLPPHRRFAGNELRASPKRPVATWPPIRWTVASCPMIMTALGGCAPPRCRASPSLPSPASGGGKGGGAVGSRRYERRIRLL